MMTCPPRHSKTYAGMELTTCLFNIKISLKCNVHFGEVILRREGNGLVGLNHVSLFFSSISPKNFLDWRRDCGLLDLGTLHLMMSRLHILLVYPALESMRVCFL